MSLWNAPDDVKDFPWDQMGYYVCQICRRELPPIEIRVECEHNGYCETCYEEKRHGDYLIRIKNQQAQKSR